MTIINKLAKLSLQRLQENTNFFTSAAIKSAIDQFKKTVYDAAATDNKIIQVAEKIIKKIPRTRFCGLPTVGLEAFLQEMRRFLYLAESLMKDRVEAEREQHIIRRLGLLTILEIEAEGEAYLTAEEKQALYGFTHLALGLNSTDEMIWDCAYKHEQKLIKQEDGRWEISLSKVLISFHRFLCDAEIFLLRDNKKTQGHSVQSTTSALVAPLNLNKNTIYADENMRSKDIKSGLKNDAAYAKTLDNVLGFSSTLMQNDYVSSFKP